MILRQKKIRKGSQSGGGNVIIADVILPCIDWVNARSGHNKETTLLGTLNDSGIEWFVIDPVLNPKWCPVSGTK